MLEKIIRFSLRYKLIVILFTLTIVGFGVYSVVNIPVGAVPDITNNQVQVITTSGNLSTQEIEQFITAPVELEMANLPGVKEIRSVSKFGLSVVTIVFDEAQGTYLPRQLIAEKIKSASANIPEGFGTPEMGPITTGLGEIYQYTLDVKPGYEKRYSPMELRTIQDWIVKRQLSGIKGVVEVNSWGGFLKQYEVAIDPQRLRALNITLMDVFDALESNNSISGGGYIEKNAQSYFIRGDAQVKSLEDVGNIVVKNKEGVPILVKDVAKVHFGYANRFGAITANGEGEKVFGQIMMLKDANSKEVIRDVKARVDEVQKSLPEGVYINPVLERSELIGKTTATVFENLLFGCIIVFIVVLLLLGNLRSALVISSMIPLALFFTLSMMFIFGIDANLMSLGALDFGIIIDGAVIIVEFVAVTLLNHKHRLDTLSGDDKHRLMDEITYDGAARMMHSAIFGQFIILIVFIPILSLQGVEGKMFRPMALAFSFAILGAMFLCLTWLPVIISLFLKPKAPSKKNISRLIVKYATLSYLPVIKWSINHKRIVLSLALGSLIFSGALLAHMGGEFVPTLDEGDFVIQPALKTGTSLSKTVELTTQMEQILKSKFSEIDQVVCRIGAAEVPTDPMSMEEIDMIIKLKPKSEWKVAKSKEELADKFKQALSVIPGVDYEFTQPIEMRFNELITGVRSDIAIKIFGEDLNYLNDKAVQIKSLVEKIPGAADVILEKTTGLPQMNVKYRRDKIAFYGVDAKTLNAYLSIAFGGQATNSVFEGEKRFDLVVRLDKSDRRDIDDIKQLQVPLANGALIPLCELADITFTEGPAKISRENTHRRVVVSVNVRGRDLKSVVTDIQSVIDKNVQLRPGNYIKYGGQFENLQNATNRLMFAVPIALALIFIFLHFAFKSMKDTIMIFTAVPLSVVGGILALWIRGMSFSISAGVGFIALFGIAVLNGIVLVEHLKHLRDTGMKDMRQLILIGATDRLRPVMLTAAAAAMGFLPMAVSTGSGAEVQRPLATVVIGGLITSTMLTMVALPLLFMLFHDDEGLKYRIVRLFKSKNFLLPLLFILSTGTAWGQSQTLTLDRAIALALAHNKDYQSYLLRVEERRALAMSKWDLDKTKIYYGFDQANVADNGHPLHTLGVEQSLPFPTVFAERNRYKQLEIAMAEMELRRQRVMLTKQVSVAYQQAMFLQSKRGFYQKLDSLYGILDESAAKRYRLGDISQLDLMNAQAKKRQSSLELEQLGYDLRNAYQQLTTLLQTDEAYSLPQVEIAQLPVVMPDFTQHVDLQTLSLNADLITSTIKIEKQRLLPDFNVGYFYANNPQKNRRGYNGFEVGVSFPLYTGAQKAKMRAGEIALNANKMQMDNSRILLESKYNQLKAELAKHQVAIDFYNTTGRQLSDEIIRSATKSYQAGAIDFYQFAQSLENSIKLQLDYYQAISAYNQTALEINYLTL
ncbi:MAG: CusA/CzcA family heavy metal efflux RND transporter [Prevotella sp.]|nr:CusA/CzcA family heavy metal efflux RND transporter [Prevotella sp.]